MEIQLPDIPARTQIDVLVPVEAIDVTTADVIHDLRGQSVEYTCIDCGFKTMSQSEMLNHQANQARYHTWWQRLRRFFCW